MHRTQPGGCQAIEGERGGREERGEKEGEGEREGGGEEGGRENKQTKLNCQHFDYSFHSKNITLTEPGANKRVNAFLKC